MTTARFSLVLLLLAACSSAPREDVEPLFRTLETGSAAEALAASEKLVAAYDDEELPRLAKALDAAPVRTLMLIGELSTEGSAKLLIDRLSYLLESKDREVARMAAVAAGLRRLKSCETMLSVMTSTELAGFLVKHAADKFFSRRLCEEAVKRPGFDAEKGLHVHEALLANPDPDLVATILADSPFPIREELVRGFLQDQRTTSKGGKLSELASKRLSR